MLGLLQNALVFSFEKCRTQTDKIHTHTCMRTNVCTDAFIQCSTKYTPAEVLVRCKAYNPS